MKKISIVIVSVFTFGVFGIANAQTDTSFNSNRTSDGYYFDTPDEPGVGSNQEYTQDTLGRLSQDRTNRRNNDLSTKPRDQSSNDNYKEYDASNKKQDLKSESDHGGYGNNQERHKARKEDTDM